MLMINSQFNLGPLPQRIWNSDQNPRDCKEQLRQQLYSSLEKDWIFKSLVQEAGISGRDK